MWNGEKSADWIPIYNVLVNLCVGSAATQQTRSAQTVIFTTVHRNDFKAFIYKYKYILVKFLSWMSVDHLF